MKKRILFFVLVVCASSVVFGQKTIEHATQLLDNEKYVEAEELLLSLTQENDVKAKAYYYLGTLYNDVYGKYKEALVFFDNCVEAINNNTDVNKPKDLSLPLYGIGNAYYGMGKYDLAFDSYEEAYKTDNTFLLGLIGMAQSEQAQGDYKSSLKILKKIKTPESIQDTDIVLAYYELSAFANYILMSYSEAVDMYNILIGMDNRIAYYYLLKGMSQMWLNLEEESDKSLHMALDIDQNDPEIYLGLAIWLDVFKEGQLKKIVEHCNKAIAIDSEMADAYYMRAFIKAKTYEYDVAYKNVFTAEEIISDFEKSLEIDPSLYEAYYGISYTHFLFNQKNKACAFFTKAESFINTPEEYKFLKKELKNCN